MEYIYNYNKIKQSIKLLTLVFVFTFTKSWGQSIWTNPITGTNPNTSNPYTTGQTVDINITVSGIGRGSGITGTAANDRYNASGWNSGALDINDYFQFTLNPCSGGDIDFVSFVYTGQASGTGPVNFAFRSSVDGYAANIGAPTAAGTTINLSAVAYQNITTPISFRIYGWGASGAGGTWSINDFTFNGTTSCGGTPHTVTFNTNGGTGGSTPAQTASSAANLTSNGFTKTGCTFAGWNTAANGSGTSYANGASYSFAADLTLYAQWNCGVSHTVTFNINGGTGGSMSNQTANAATNLTSNAFTKTGCIFTGWNTAANGSGTAYTNSQSYSFAADMTLYAQWNCSPACPYIQAAVINACPGSCGGEGNNEIVVMNSGSYSIPVSPANIQVVYSGGSPALQNFTESFGAQPGIISNLNSMSGCGNLFVDASAGTIPANSVFFVMNQGDCLNSGSFSSYCGLGTIYVVFSTDPSWLAAGYFGNNSTPRYFQTNFSGVNAACGVTTYSYNNSNEFAFGTDGASVSFNGTTPNYVPGDGTCVPPAIILPIELTDFYASQNGAGNNLIWKVASEKNVSQYIIEKSEDGINFNELTKVKAKNIDGSYLSYTCDDNSPYDRITYYRLSTEELNGKIYYHQVIDVDKSNKDWNPIIYQNNDNLFLEFKNTIPKNSTICLVDLSGKLLAEEIVKDSQTKINVQNFEKGIYFIKIQSPYKTENFKIIIDK